MSSTEAKDALPKYVHNGLKVFVLPKKQDSLEDNEFFKQMYEDLEETEDISITASFTHPFPPIPSVLPTASNPISPSITVLEPVPTYPPLSTDLEDTNIKAPPRKTKTDPRTPGPKDEVDEGGGGGEMMVDGQVQTNVSIVDERFKLEEIQAQAATVIGTSDKNESTEVTSTRQIGSETTSDLLRLDLVHRQVETGPVYVYEQNEIDELKRNIQDLEEEKLHVENLLLEQQISITSNLENQIPYVRTSSISCQATSEQVEAQSQTTVVRNDVAIMTTQTDSAVDGDNDDDDERDAMILSLQQQQLASERQLRAKIGEMDLLESKIYDVEKANQDAQQNASALQQQINSLNKEIMEKNELLKEIESMKKDEKRVTIEEERQKVATKEADLLERMDELKGEKIELGYDRRNTLGHNTLKTRYDELNAKSEVLESNLKETKLRIDALNLLLRNKDELLKQLIGDTKYVKETVKPLKRFDTDEEEDKEIRNILDSDEIISIDSQNTKKKKVPTATLR